MTFLRPRLPARRRLALTSALAAVSAAAIVSVTFRADAQMVDTELDLCAMKPTFTEEFDKLNVASRIIDDKTWIAHTPWNGDFGDAEFTDPGERSPFSVKDGILSITASKDEKGKWRSGLLASADGNGQGYSQRYGYFEARMKLPEGPGVWPAFWLSSSQTGDEKKKPAVEIDTIEYYGHDPAAYMSAIHVWHRSPVRDEAKMQKTEVPSESLSADFHTYGVKVMPDYVTYYLDRKPVWQVKTPVEHKAPLLIMVNLALGSGFPIDKTPDPSVLLVDYVHAFEIGANAEPREGCKS